MLVTLTPGINFIKILRVHFLYERKPNSKQRKAAQKTFLRKIIEYNLDEIDHWSKKWPSAQGTSN